MVGLTGTGMYLENRLQEQQVAALMLSSRLWNGFRRLARRRLLACVLLGILPIAVRVATRRYFPLPDPTVTDEYSYLLGADTFASGRVTNPQHPMWQHFETWQVISQ